MRPKYQPSNGADLSDWHRYVIMETGRSILDHHAMCFPCQGETACAEERERRSGQSPDWQRIDAWTMTVPCKHCGGRPRVLADGTTHFMLCDRTDFCKQLVSAEGWPYNVMALWNEANHPGEWTEEEKLVLKAEMEARLARARGKRFS